MLLKTKYQEAWVEGNVLIFKWLPDTVNMKDDEYIAEIKKAAELIKDQKKSYVILLAKEMRYIISLAYQHKANDILLPAYNDSGVKKLAVVVPQHMIATLAIEQTIEEKRVFHNFETRYFSDEQQARDWLSS